MQVNEIKIPDLGASVHVAEILVSVGDSVIKDQPIAVLESDKASLDLLSPYAGYVDSILINQGDTCKPDDVFCHLKEIEDAPSQTVSASVDVQTFNLPDMGGVSSQVAEIHKKEGEYVNKDDVVLSLESDKAMMDIPAPKSGLIKSILVKNGDQVNTDQPWLTMQCQQDDQPAQMVKTAHTVVDTEAQQPQYSDTTAAGPKVRKLAREWGVDITQVRGTGFKGRISENDLKSFVQNRLMNQTSPVETVPQKEHDFSAFGAVDRQALSRINMISAKHLTKCWQIPQVTQFFDVDFTMLEKTRQALKAPLKAQGLRMTPMVFMMKALSKTMQLFPKFNASLSVKEDALLLKNYCHMGFAVDTPGGLVVAVIRDVDKKDYKQLSQEIMTLSEDARENTLKPQQMQGGCITISSLGGIGGQGFTPIVNAPEVAIIGVGKAQMKPVFVNGAFEPRYCIPMALSYDHRVIDGADAARFVVKLTDELEHMGQVLSTHDILGDK